MNIEREQGFWLWWVAASVVGLAMGGVLPIIGSFGSAMSGMKFGTECLAVGGALVGASLGIAQWLVLRGQISRAGWWVLASTMGSAVGWVVASAAGGAVSLAMLEEEAVDLGVATVVVGASLGIAQWPVLRGQASRAGWWVLASTVGSAVSAAALVFVLEHVFETKIPGRLFLVLVPAVLYGAITGAVMVWLLRQPSREA